jgi:hypothetical protein
MTPLATGDLLGLGLDAGELAGGLVTDAVGEELADGDGEGLADGEGEVVVEDGDVLVERDRVADGDRLADGEVLAEAVGEPVGVAEISTVGVGSVAGSTRPPGSEAVLAMTRISTSRSASNPMINNMAGGTDGPRPRRRAARSPSSS